MLTFTIFNYLSYICTKKVMFTDKDIIKKIVKVSKNGVKYTLNIYSCKGCKKELKMKKFHATKHKGLCRECITKNISKINNKKTKTCKKCELNLSIDSFNKTHSGKYTNSICLKCYNLKKYDINYKEYLKILRKQNGLCAICKKPEKIITKGEKVCLLAVDHNHETGKVRGLLCYKCNISIGHLEENITILKNAIKYLKKYVKNSKEARKIK